MEVMRLALTLILGLLTSGCTTLGYYGQAVGGQMSVLAARRPIAEVIADPAADPVVVARLGVVERARAFAATELALPDSGSYRSFVALDRPYPVWSLFAAPELSLTPRTWCYLFIGCLPYRGYFDEAAARRAAARLERDGWDTVVAPVPAYSTLGWFDDPVFSSMLAWDEATLVEMLFHELAHERLYTGDDTAFDEAYATAVARAGLQRFLDDPGLQAREERRRRAERGFTSLLLAVRAELERVYGTEPDPERRRAAKRAGFEYLASEARALGARLGDPALFDGFFATPVNNARLALVATYDELVPQFERLLAAEEGNMARFHARVEALARLPQDERRAALAGAAQSRP
jgi:predicted aminopeptidase